MGLIYNFSIASLFLCLLFISAARASNTTGLLNVVDYGAVADGKTDSTKAFQTAWNEACASEGNSGVLIPEGSFLVGPLTFKGPCKSSIMLQLNGTMLAATDLSVFSGTKFSDWLNFRYLDGLTITGGGTFHGQGAAAWSLNNCRGKQNCKMLPKSISFSSMTNTTIENISSIDSKNFHMHVYSCKDMTFRSLNISAPKESPNTDGIHLSNCNNIEITDTVISTGDDCISIGPGNHNISISNVFCGPGHGISIGSLGGRLNEGDVTDISVTNCTLEGTQNGVRIKAWQGSLSALAASNFTFEDVVMKNVDNPIVIDQNYCPDNACAHKTPSKVKISNIKFRNIRGDSTTPVAVSLVCSDENPCQDIVLHDINLKYVGDGQEATVNCTNAQGTSVGLVIPEPCF